MKIGFILLAIIIFGGLSIIIRDGNGKPASNADVSNTTSSTTNSVDVKHYENKDYQFSFAYPADGTTYDAVTNSQGIVPRGAPSGVVPPSLVWIYLPEQYSDLKGGYMNYIIDVSLGSFLEDRVTPDFAVKSREYRAEFKDGTNTYAIILDGDLEEVPQSVKKTFEAVRNSFRTKN